MATTRTKAVRDSMRKMILELGEGSKIHGEFDLCRSFGVSRGTIRDAISMLAAEGLLEKRHGVGTFVGRGKKADWQTNVILLVRCVSIPQVAGYLEGRVADYNFMKYETVVSEESIGRKVLYSSTIWNSAANFEKRLDALPHNSRLLGVILSDAMDHPERKELEKLLNARHIRFCAVDPVDVEPYTCSIGIHLEPGIIAGLEKLWGLGHRRIAFIGLERYLFGPDAGELTGRMRVFLDFFRNPRYRACKVTVMNDDGEYLRAYENAEKLLCSRNHPTAIFCHNDVRAIIVLKACSKLGIKVPEDLSLFGFDNSPEVEQVTPSLSSVDLRIEDRVRIALRYLDGELSDSDFPHVLDSRFIDRESIGRANA